jgi:hypothetical protein
MLLKTPPATDRDEQGIALQHHALPHACIDYVDRLSLSLEQRRTLLAEVANHLADGAIVTVTRSPYRNCTQRYGRRLRRNPNRSTP